MGHSATDHCQHPAVFLILSLLFLSPFLPPAEAFDLTSLLEALGGKTETPKCPTHCNCSTRRAEDVMQDYLTSYLPDMGLHMQPDLEKEARAVVTVFTAWIGRMAEIHCHLPEGEMVNLTELLQGSTLSFKSLTLTCGVGSGVVWNVSPFDAFLNILDVSGCKVEKARGVETLAVPLNLWVLDLDDLPPEAVQSLDLSTGQTLLALSVTNSSLSSLPSHWSSVAIHRLMVVRLAHNDLTNFTCEITTSMLSTLNLDHNNLTAVPECVLDGSTYAHHLSVRHNNIRSLAGPLLHTSQNSGKPSPHVMYLDVSHNNLDRLPPLSQAGLFSLDLSHNRIHSIAGDSLNSNQLLKWLDLSHNKLKDVPDGALAVLPLLHHLNLSHNLLSSFDFDQSPLSTKIVTLDLRYNQLIYPPFADTGYVAPRLSRISAANNPYRCDCPLSVFLDFLSVVNSTKQHWFSLGYWELYDHDSSIVQPYVDVKDFTCSQPAEMKDKHLQTLSFKKSCPLMGGCPAECSCHLRRGEGELVLVDCSHSMSMTELPDELPLVSNASVSLYVNGSGLTRLDHRPYLRHVSEIHAEDSQLSSVSPGAMEALQNVRVLILDHNELSSLPAVTQNLTMAAASQISLGNNPWTCGCKDLWMPQWLAKHAHVLYKVNSVRCRWTGKPVTRLEPSDLKCEIFNYVPLVITLSTLLVLAVITASFLVKYKLEVLVFLYTRFRVRPFDMYKYNKAKPYQFDIFVSFSQHDYHWVVEKLVDQLENRARPYRLCIHLRDFPVGAPIADSVSWAVNNSRCTLLVLTKDFLASEWCRHEFRAAHARLLKDPNTKLLIVVHGPVDARKLDRELLAYLRTNTYLRTEDKWFWGKLEYALPAPQEDMMVVGGDMEWERDGERERENGGPVPVIEMDTIVPVALAAGDQFPRPDC